MSLNFEFEKNKLKKAKKHPPGQILIGGVEVDHRMTLKQQQPQYLNNSMECK